MLLVMHEYALLLIIHILVNLLLELLLVKLLVGDIAGLIDLLKFLISARRKEVGCRSSNRLLLECWVFIDLIDLITSHSLLFNVHVLLCDLA